MWSNFDAASTRSQLEDSAEIFSCQLEEPAALLFSARPAPFLLAKLFESIAVRVPGAAPRGSMSIDTTNSKRSDLPEPVFVIVVNEDSGPERHFFF